MVATIDLLILGGLGLLTVLFLFRGFIFGASRPSAADKFAQVDVAEATDFVSSLQAQVCSPRPARCLFPLLLIHVFWLTLYVRAGQASGHLLRVTDGHRGGVCNQVC